MAKKRSNKISVLIADDHSLFAAAVRTIVEADARFEVVGLARDGAVAVQEAEAKRPDVVLMDISMPVLDGFQATREIGKRAPGTRVLILSGSASRTDIDKARKAGAAGYITKDRIASELIEAILEVVGR